MERLIVSTFSEDGSIVLYLDDVEISLERGQIEISLETGDEYLLHWFVKGKPKSVFSVTVSSPRMAEFNLTKRLGLGGKEIGGYHFKL
ncbi:hypothetical protein [Algoriphagus sp. NG3]|uniref:hypothetical protein n=1 Tax=Algoriphagus sp. NG3 TaxID=3097546 RepID=UPI002A825148|nr:hypothetical protein [Algoriphagus sp. NG3]WPR77684.1 hypothetical protein SLW71_10045 [Algoriphagus sp. NG3]